MHNSTEHEILNAPKYKNILEIQLFSDSDKPIMLFFLLINVKMPTKGTTRKLFMLSGVELENFFITSGHVYSYGPEEQSVKLLIANNMSEV